VFEDVVREGIAMPGITSSVGVVEPSAPDAPLVDDPLTSVADLPSWRRRATSMMAARRGAAQPMAMFLVDLDDFSRVNATYGRLQGDDVLWAVAKVLQRGLRSGDLIGRRGSDEFVVLLPDTPPDLALEIAERLRDTVTSLRCARRDADGETIAVSRCSGRAARAGPRWSLPTAVTWPTPAPPSTSPPSSTGRTSSGPSWRNSILLPVASHASCR
jgi:diguanylate cyclase (GGDEF)-like protein